MGSASVAYANEFKPYQVVPPNPRYDSQSAWNSRRKCIEDRSELDLVCCRAGGGRVLAAHRLQVSYKEAAKRIFIRTMPVLYGYERSRCHTRDIPVARL